jgi:hypothetical protein
MQLTESPAEQTPQDDPLAKKWSKRIDLALKKDEERKKLFKKLRSFVRGDHGVVSNDDVRGRANWNSTTIRIRIGCGLTENANTRG